MMNGVLVICKERGYTSHDVVAKLRSITKQRKIGHTGTLDPEAEGVLPVCLGHATKLCGMLTDKDKTYEAELCLGITTDTQDR
ncbi:MAG TPA: tRNA pseudouridine(55) synthase, partial [Candidatus Caccomorpha excrementavium]|nr:tRNA pseudouridine(55) synthase [Candidatus Caccomorpha excrementavium]